MNDSFYISYRIEGGLFILRAVHLFHIYHLINVLFIQQIYTYILILTSKSIYFYRTVVIFKYKNKSLLSHLNRKMLFEIFQI
jgi:hypothetical protein